jgi:hypothetical protein
VCDQSFDHAYPFPYTGAQARPLFIDVPVEYRTPSLDLSFITDRAS